MPENSRRDFASRYSNQSKSRDDRLRLAMAGASLLTVLFALIRYTNIKSTITSVVHALSFRSTRSFSFFLSLFVLYHSFPLALSRKRDEEKIVLSLVQFASECASCALRSIRVSVFCVFCLSAVCTFVDVFVGFFFFRYFRLCFCCGSIENDALELIVSFVAHTHDFCRDFSFCFDFERRLFLHTLNIILLSLGRSAR